MAVKRLRHVVWAVLLTWALPLGALAQNHSGGDTPPLNVVTTTGMIADAAQIIGGDLVQVIALMGPGVDPHAYRPTRSDIVTLAGADLVLWNGLFLEAQLQDVLRDLGQDHAVVAVAETLPPSVLRAADEATTRYDPHVWMDPTLWMRVVGATRDALIDIYPQGVMTFTQNAADYTAQIRDHNATALGVMGTIPPQARVLVTAHDAFGYFGAAYGLEVVGIQGISTESEAGLRRISDLVDMLVARDIGAVFVETSVSDRNMRALVEGAAAQGHDVIIGGEVFSDAMGAAGTYEGTYLGMIEHNTTVIARALGGKAPARGWSGRLSSPQDGP